MAELTTSGELEQRFNELYEATVRPTTGYLMARCRRQADLADLLQETYLEVFRALSRTPVQRLRSGPALVRQIAKQRLYRYYRKLERLDEISLTQQPDETDDGEVNLSDIKQLEDYLSEGPDDLVYDRIIMEQIHGMIKEAPEFDREIVRMRYGLDLTFREIADVLECPESTVKSRLYRFLKKVREAHEDVG